MIEDSPRPSGIGMHKTGIGPNLPGLLFTIGMVAWFLIGVPWLRVFLLMSIAVGSVIAVVLRRSGISMDQIRSGASVPSLLLMVGSAAFVLIGVPSLRIFLLISIAAGSIVALIFRIGRR